MRLNVTFIIQIMNFWITYLFLKRLLLKPLVTTFTRREKTRLQILEMLKQKELFLKQKMEDKNKMLIEFQRSLKKKYTVTPFEYPEIPLEIAYQRNKNVIDNLILMSKDILVKKVPYAYHK